MILKTPLTPKSSRLPYYARAIGTLAGGLRPSVGATALLWSPRLGRPQMVTLQPSGLRFLVRDRMDVWMLKEVCLDRDYERAGVPIQDGWTIIDVGAGIGEFAIDVAARHPNCIVYAFEPSPSAYDLLRGNIALNRPVKVRTYQAAIGSTSADLDVSASSTVFHKLARPGDAPPGTRLPVTVLTLEAALEGLGIKHCDFLKMDCEGGEYDVLLGAPPDTLGRISRICLEYHDGPDHQHGELVAKLTSAGFRVRLTENPVYRELGYLFAERISENR